MKLSVIIPVFNERETLPLVLREVQAVPIKKEIIIVDDFSTDGTREFLKSINDNSIKIFFHEKNMGKGAAVRTAQPHITGDVVIIQDAVSNHLKCNPERYRQII